MENAELTAMQEFFFVNVTSFIAILGGLLLWIGLGLEALIMRRFARAYSQPSRWQWMFFSPAGLAGYLVLQAAASLAHQQLDGLGLWLSYGLLGLSAVVSLWCQVDFLRLISRLNREP
jgi:hypothetical protein